MKEVYVIRALELLLVGISPEVVMFQCDECVHCHTHYVINDGALNIDWSPFILDDPGLEYRDYCAHIERHVHFMDELGLSIHWEYDTDGQMEVLGRLYDLDVVLYPECVDDISF